MDAHTSPTSSDTPEPEARSPFRPNRLTSGIVAGGAALAMVLAGLGIASAQTDGSTTTDPPAAPAEGDGTAAPHRRRGSGWAGLSTVATTLGTTVEELEAKLAAGQTIAAVAGDETDEVIAALVAEATEHLDAGVAAGRLTPAQADERRARVQERITALVNRTPGKGERGGRRAGGRRAEKISLSVAASALGTTEEALRTELQAGKTLAAIAGDKTPALIEALVTAAQAHIDRAVTDGKLTAEQAAERKAGLTERITARVNATRAAGAGHGGGHRRGPAPAHSGEAGAAPASVTA